MVSMYKTKLTNIETIILFLILVSIAWKKPYFYPKNMEVLDKIVSSNNYTETSKCVK